LETSSGGRSHQDTVAGCIVLSVTASSSLAVAIYVSRGQREGRTLDNKNVLVSHIRNGRLAEAWQLSEDQYAADEFLA
jgi:hypothetical protein